MIITRIYIYVCHQIACKSIVFTSHTWMHKGCYVLCTQKLWRKLYECRCECSIENRRSLHPNEGKFLSLKLSNMFEFTDHSESQSFPDKIFKIANYRQCRQIMQRMRTGEPQNIIRDVLTVGSLWSPSNLWHKINKEKPQI